MVSISLSIVDHTEIENLINFLLLELLQYLLSIKTLLMAVQLHCIVAWNCFLMHLSFLFLLENFINEYWLGLWPATRFFSKFYSKLCMVKIRSWNVKRGLLILDFPSYVQCLFMLRYAQMKVFVFSKSVITPITTINTVCYAHPNCEPKR